MAYVGKNCVHIQARLGAYSGKIGGYSGKKGAYAGKKGAYAGKLGIYTGKIGCLYRQDWVNLSNIWCLFNNVGCLFRQDWVPMQLSLGENADRICF